jgi:hypothetical protein
MKRYPLLLIIKRSFRVISVVHLEEGEKKEIKRIFFLEAKDHEQS